VVNKVKVGDKAPNFSLLDVENRTRSLKEFLGQKVVLVFFVGAFTSTCTKELCVFRDSMAQLIDLNAQIVGIDVNVPSANKGLAKKNKLPFPILSDYKHEVIEAYGLAVPDFAGPEGDSNACCWGSGCYPIAKRSIFILDENGVVHYTWVSDSRTVEPSYEELKKVLEHSALKEPAATIPRSVITISRQVGSGGDEIALKISEVLGYAYFDKSLMISEAKSLGISEEEIADFSEDAYKVKSFVDRILLRKKPVAISHTLKDHEMIRKTLDEEECLSAIQTVIKSLASRGKTIIVGRGGQAILKHKVGVLHVRIVAPLAVRVERIMKNGGLSREDALKWIEDNDKAAAEYLRRFYDIDWENPAVYDLVLNTGKMDLDSASRLIATVALQECRIFK
jgi:peroxiredoxin/cytidylate kinase